MKAVAILLTLVTAVVYARPEEEPYNVEYDNFNSKGLTENEANLKSYMKCFLGEGDCTKEGADIKKVIPEALRTKCGRCTPKQREHVRAVVQAFREKIPDMWNQLTKKEDPKGEFKEAFEDFLAKKD